MGFGLRLSRPARRMAAAAQTVAAAMRAIGMSGTPIAGAPREIATLSQTLPANASAMAPAPRRASRLQIGLRTQRYGPTTTTRRGASQGPGVPRPMVAKSDRHQNQGRPERRWPHEGLGGRAVVGQDPPWRVHPTETRQDEGEQEVP